MTKSLAWRIAPIAVGALLLFVAHQVPAEVRPTNIGLGALILLAEALILFGIALVLSTLLRAGRSHPVTEQSSQRTVEPGGSGNYPVFPTDTGARSSVSSARRRAEDKIASRFAEDKAAASGVVAPGGDVSVIFTSLLSGYTILIGIWTITSGTWGGVVFLIGGLALVAAGIANGRNLRRN